MARDPAKAKAKNGLLSWSRLFGKDNPITDPLDIEIVDGKVVRGLSIPVEETDLAPEDLEATTVEPVQEVTVKETSHVPITEVPLSELSHLVQTSEPQISQTIEDPVPVVAPVVEPPIAPPPQPLPTPPAPDFHSAVIASSIALMHAAQHKNSRPSEASDRNMRFRIPGKYGNLKSQFAAKCESNGQDMSKVLVNLMRAYCAMLIILISSVSANDTKFTTSDIINFCTNKCGYSWFESIPVNVTASARSAAVDAGTGMDTSALFYGRHRVELAVSIPIWSASSSRQIKREKSEFISAILRDLAKLLNEEKLVATMESQVKALREANTRVAARVTSGQANQSDLEKSAMALSNGLYKLIELRSRLDELIFGIAARAGDDWQKARNMVIAWDRKLYD